MKEIWIIGSGGSNADGVGFELALGDSDDIKKLLCEKVKRDKEYDEEIWVQGTECVEDVEERITHTLYAYSVFMDYHIDYEAIPFKEIRVDAQI